MGRQTVCILVILLVDPRYTADYNCTFYPGRDKRIINHHSFAYTGCFYIVLCGFPAIINSFLQE